MSVVLGLIVRRRFATTNGLSLRAKRSNLDLHQCRLTTDVAPDFAEALYERAVRQP
jgi:hypothetical protein